MQPAQASLHNNDNVKGRKVNEPSVRNDLHGYTYAISYRTVSEPWMRHGAHKKGVGHFYLTVTRQGRGASKLYIVVPENEEYQGIYQKIGDRHILQIGTTDTVDWIWLRYIEGNSQAIQISVTNDAGESQIYTVLI